MSKIRRLVLALVLTGFAWNIQQSTYANDFPSTTVDQQPDQTTASPKQAAPDIAGVYRLTTAKRTLLKATKDPLAGYYLVKGKLVVERLNPETFLVFKAETVKNSGTLAYVEIFEFIDGQFREKVAYRYTDNLVGNVSIRFQHEAITISMNDHDQFETISEWHRIDPSTERKDKYLEKNLASARQQFASYGAREYKALRAKTSQ